jgi:hypothetical protein
MPPFTSPEDFQKGVLLDGFGHMGIAASFENLDPISF